MAGGQRLITDGKIVLQKPLRMFYSLAFSDVFYSCSNYKQTNASLIILKMIVMYNSHFTYY